MNEYFEIFRTGLHTDSAGHEKDWTEADLNTIAARYNEQKEHEAPLVIGHPETNHPAYGWVESLKVEGGKLLAKAAQIVPEFAEAIKNGLFKKRSISLYQDLLLRHVGFLGAVPPAVKGLKDMTFSDMDKCTLIETATIPEVISFAEYEKVKTSLAATELKAAELTEKLKLSESKFASLTERHAEIINSQQLLQKKFAEFRQSTADREFKSFMDAKMAARAITPAQAEMVYQFKKDLEGSETENLNFEETTKRTDFLKNFVETLPRILPDHVDIPGTEPDTKAFDPFAVALKARDFVETERKKGIFISFTQAVDNVKALFQKLT